MKDFGIKLKTNLIIFTIICLTLLTTVSTQDEVPTEPIAIEQQSKNFSDSFLSGFGLIFVSEIGDRTFFMIMIFASTNSFLLTFLLSSLTMLFLNLISLSVGFALPLFLYRDLIDWIGILVFTVFGLKMLYDAYFMKDSLIEDELEEVIEELEKEEQDDDEYQNLKVGLIKEKTPHFKSTWAFVTSLIIAEMGDKSQISAIVLGAMNNFYGVLLGTSLAFLTCILAAIFFGNILAKKLTHRQLMICGGVMFLLFAVLYAAQKII
jgi:putative Ca2+/H+ antiporter (TMEM165/GDT1 family)